uniref:Uncharacterized protein n=1 Tax=Oryza glumipatula TaxID=40148 RepID=A0A0D9ZZM5_9ORYZ
MQDSGIAWFLFGVGAVVNIEGKRATMPDCYVVKRGIFAGAAVLALAATAFGITMAGKMDKTTIIVSAVVGSLGLLSAILGFSAEGTKITVTDILVGGKCLYPENPATALGVCAAVFLLLAQITVSAVGGCCGCCKSRSIPSETKRIIGVICAVMSCHRRYHRRYGVVILDEP